MDLLEEPLLGTECAAGERRGCSLPEVLALLGRDEIRAFTALQAHQQHGWHAFLVQLAAIALHQAGETEPRHAAKRWEELLLALTKRAREPWCLVVEDLSKTAFMQPPVPEGTLDAFKESQRYPDELDVLVTSKNHDVKSARIASPRPEHWIYTLVTLQTMQGFSGRSNYGIARMNSGDGSRPVVGLTPTFSPGARWKRDVGIALSVRDHIASGFGYRRRAGLSLVWTVPWDGDSSLSLDDLDPLFIEVCRRLRVVTVGDKLVCARATSECNRIAAKEQKGNTGDLWTPIRAAEGSALTVSERGFSYRLTQQLLLGADFEVSPAASPACVDHDCWWVGTVLARGKGKTRGFHQRAVPVSAKVAKVLARADSRADVGRVAQERVELVSTVQNRVLRPALKTLLQGAPEKLKQDDDRPDAWVRAHDAAIDAVFFKRLWADLDRDPAAAAREWAQLVIDLARSRLESAIEEAPIPTARKYRAIATAERVFEGAARNHVSIAFSSPEVDHER